jgi:hypothetical protein
VRFYFRHAKELCGLDHDFEIRSEEDYNFALRVWKEKTVAARQANNDELAAMLSQAKQVFKRRYTRLVSIHCPTCGNSKSQYAYQCHMCARINRYYHNQVPQSSIVMKEHEIEEAVVLIPPRLHATGVLTGVLRKLATTGKIGDSFVTDKQPTSVKNIARSLGMEVTVRIANLEEHDKKKRRWRVWRTDGLEMEAVNEIIRKRLAGEPVLESKPCVPPPPGTIPDRHKKKGAGSSSSEWGGRGRKPVVESKGAAA